MRFLGRFTLVGVFVGIAVIMYGYALKWVGVLYEINSILANGLVAFITVTSIGVFLYILSKYVDVLQYYLEEDDEEDIRTRELEKDEQRVMARKGFERIVKKKD